ncbi:unnamed protein product [Brassica rapa]|nr:unnamed protein product [Brassica rapa]
MGIDPVTHKHKNETLLSSTGQSKNLATLSHMAQWESARLEAEARLARESKLLHVQHHRNNKPAAPDYCLAHKSSSTNWTKPNQGNGDQQLESPTSTSTVTFSENLPLMIMHLGIPTENRNSRVAVSSSTSSIKDSDHDWIKQINCPKEGFTSLLLRDSVDRSLSAGKNDESEYSYYEDNKNYWNSILSLVDSSPSDSPTMF